MFEPSINIRFLLSEIHKLRLKIISWLFRYPEVIRHLPSYCTKNWHFIRVGCSQSILIAFSFHKIGPPGKVSTFFVKREISSHQFSCTTSGSLPRSLTIFHSLDFSIAFIWTMLLMLMKPWKLEFHSHVYSLPDSDKHFC